MKKLVAILWVFAASAACAFAVGFGEFKNVSMRDKPWCYWWWVNGHVDKETITADLEAMKEVGFGGCLQFDARGYWEDSNHLLYP
ncbi:MAG: glycosyl hydrolase, partial [Bacilli bacterium]